MKPLRFLFTALIALRGVGLPDGPAHAAEKMVDRWQAYVTREGKPAYGYRHVRLETLPDGSRKYTVQSKQLVEFLGQQQDIDTRGEYLVDAQLLPISFKLQTTQLSGETTTIGTVEKGMLMIETNLAEITRTHVIAVTANTRFMVTLEDLLHQQPKSLRQVSYDLIDEQSWVSQPCVAARQDENTWLVNLSPDQGSTRIHWEGDSDTATHRSQSPTRLLVPADEHIASNLSRMLLTGRDILLFEANQNIAFPEKLKSMTVKLRWKEFPIDKMSLSGSHQQLLSTVIAKDRTEALVELSHTPESSKLDVADKDAPMEPFLADTRFIKPSDVAIIAKAKEWTAGAQNNREAALLLCHRVFEYMQGGQLIVETLSGPEVLQCKKGKCSEYTSLYASLARSLGIPTRVALGERLTAGNWVGHMWCEVYLGQWIPVDASVDEFGGSPALLKLTDSHSVMGTQSARFGVAESLDINIVGWEKSSEPASELRTGIVGGTYTNADFSCRLSAPAEGWTLEDKSKNGPVIIQFHIPDEPKEDPPLVHFVAIGLPSPVPAQLLVTARRLRFASLYKEFKVLEDVAFSVDNEPGRRFAFSRADKENVPYKTTEIIWTSGNSAYILNLIAPADAHDNWLPEFEKILESFERTN